MLKRFSRWCHAGVWERVFEALTADRNNQYLMIDSRIVRAHEDRFPAASLPINVSTHTLIYN